MRKPPDTPEPVDPRFLGGADESSGLVMTDVSKMAFVFTVDYNGVADMKAGDNISHEQAASWLREIADQLDPNHESEAL